MNSFRWIEGAITSDCKQNIVRITHSSLNFRDVMIASGKLVIDCFYLSRGRLEDCTIGMEYVGVDNTGQRVMGICENRYVTVTQSLKNIFISKKKLTLFKVNFTIR